MVGGRWSPRLARKALGGRSLTDPLSRLTHCHPWWGQAGLGWGGRVTCMPG